MLISSLRIETWIGLDIIVCLVVVSPKQAAQTEAADSMDGVYMKNFPSVKHKLMKVAACLRITLTLGRESREQIFSRKS